MIEKEKVEMIERDLNLPKAQAVHPNLDLLLDLTPERDLKGT
jgi:hypothetical protein